MRLFVCMFFLYLLSLAYLGFCLGFVGKAVFVVGVTVDRRWSLFAMLLAAVLCVVCMLPRVALAAAGDVVIEDEVQRGGIKIRKLLPIAGGSVAEGDTHVEGTQFTIELAQGNSVYVGNRWYSVGDVICTITADATGWATTPNNYLPYGTYTIRESKLNDGQYEAMIGDAVWSKTVSVRSDKAIVDAGSVTNDMWRSTISVVKSDVELGYAQGDADLSNAIFTVYNRSAAPIRYRDKDGNLHNVAVDAAIPDTMVTDKEGKASLPEGALEYGTYEVVETMPPHKTDSGELMYVPQDPVWSSGNLVLHGKDETISAGTCANRVVRGGLNITKYDVERDTPNPQGDGTLDAEYSIYNDSKGPVLVNGTVYQRNEVVYVMRADKETGAWSVPGDTLPYGTYTVRESNPGTGYNVDNNWSYSFQVRTDGRIYGPSATDTNKNAPIRGGIQVIKLDADSNLTTPQGDGDFDGIEISIYNAAAHSILFEGQDIAPGELVTKIYMNDGVANTAELALPYGRYSLRETNVPQSVGYRINLMWNPTVMVSKQNQWATVLVEP